MVATGLARLKCSHRRFDCCPLTVDQKIGRRGQGHACRLQDAIGLHALHHQQALAHVPLGMGEGIANHALNLVVSQTVARLHPDGRFLAGGFFARGDAEKAVGVDQEGDLQARHARRHGRDAGQLETRQRAAVRHQLAFSLHHVQVKPGLVVGIGGEGLHSAAGHGGVAMDQLLRHPAHHLQTERERHHVHQHHILARVARQQVGLHRRAQGHHLVGIDVSQGLAPEEAGDQSPHDRHAGGAAHQDHAGKLLRLQARVAQRPTRGRLAAIEDRPHHVVQLVARERPTPDVTWPPFDDNFRRAELGQRLFRVPRRI